TTIIEEDFIRTCVFEIVSSIQIITIFSFRENIE
ncbi:MAG: hypothetical protein ACI8V2_000871, partial [Candidatus Latescibacterota bacterium]